MKIRKWLDVTARTLAPTSTSPRLDAEVLLCDALSQNKAWLLSRGDDVVDESVLHSLSQQVKRRAQGEPLAYIRGFAEFYGRTFNVNQHVLVPRPESEAMIDLLVDKWRVASGDQMSLIIDVGAGSGAVGITAALELQKLSTFDLRPTTTLIDIDPNCLKVAKKNAKTHGVEAKFLCGNLLEPYYALNSSPSALVLLANLPYVPEDYNINNAAKHEPALALFAGHDGLDLYRELFAQMRSQSLEIKDITLYTESLIFQHSELRKIAESVGYTQIEEKDLIQVFSPNTNN